MCLLCLFAFPKVAMCQEKKLYASHHFDNSSTSILAQPFYFFTLIQELKPLKRILEKDKVLIGMTTRQHKLLKEIEQNPTDTSTYWLDSLRWSMKEIEEISTALKNVFIKVPAIKKRFVNQLKPSGNFILYHHMDDLLFIEQVWRNTATGINNIIEYYGLGMKMRYPNIDSASYNIHLPYYKKLVRFYAGKQPKATLFFQPSLHLVTNLLKINGRDEWKKGNCLMNHENKKALATLRHTDWKKFSYSLLMVPGAGPFEWMRCDTAAARYRNGLAPVIVLSGGFVHPFRTYFCEALEMKKYLMAVWQIPEEAILIDALARHTTTNFRNVARIVFRNKLPTDKKALWIAQAWQTDYVWKPEKYFDERNLHELGYLPYIKLNRVSPMEIEFLPRLQSLQLNLADPLDP